MWADLSPTRHTLGYVTALNDVDIIVKFYVKSILTVTGGRCVSALQVTSLFYYCVG